MDHKIPVEEILESVVERFTTEFRAGNNPSVEDFQAEYPDLSEDIREMLSSVIMIEQLKESSKASSQQARLFDELLHLKEIDSYRIIKEIGRGGMGVVFAAEHQSLKRKVAIKVMPIPKLDGEKAVDRFAREAQAAAKLHHTNIASVFGVGQGQGFYYYVMDLVQGHCLSEVIQSWRETPDSKKKSDFRWLATLGANLSDALSYAHSHGILHRDIKPSNLILDHQDTLWITDFGLAKDVSCNSQLTQIGEVVGTPQYLPPESLDGIYDQRSEVYGVGLILYELTTLRAAYSGGSPAELIRAIATQSPQAVRRVNPKVPLDLATIIDKALSRDPLHRYATANELQQDLAAFADGRSIAARRPSPLETVKRWAKRNPLSAGLSAISAILLCLVAVTATLGYWTASNALKKEAEVSHSLREQQQALRDQQQATEAARSQAEQNLLLLQKQHQRAESNLALTLDAFDQMFNALVSRRVPVELTVDIDGYRELSGLETALTKQDAEFLDQMVVFYQQFAALNSENDNLRSEAAKAFRRLGNIYQLVGQIKPAIDAYRESLRLLPESPSGSSEDKSSTLIRVRTRNELSNALRRNGQPSQAEQLYRQSIQELDASSLGEKDPELRLELARTLAALGFNMMRVLGTGQLTINDGLNEMGARRQRNRPLNHQAIEILDELIKEDPNNIEAQEVRATCYWNLAAGSIDQDRKKGIKYRTVAVDSLEQLVQSQPENCQYKYLLSLACSLVSSTLDKSELELLERGTQMIEKLIDQRPSMLDYQHLHVNLRVKQAGFYLANKEWDRAYQELRSARSSIDILQERSVSDRSYSITAGLLVRELQLLARAYRESGNQRSANEINQYLLQLRDYRRSIDKPPAP